MKQILCPKCNGESWRYWVIYGPNSEFVCTVCGFKIKTQPEYVYEYKTYRLWNKGNSAIMEGDYK